MLFCFKGSFWHFSGDALAATGVHLIIVFLFCFWPMWFYVWQSIGLLFWRVTVLCIRGAFLVVSLSRSISKSMS
ncbi:unnamed protein product [Trifolium pratense]|uniref:Uncharacterized protein n=1 Tax=Trifolium pratense TaxID=57577 RepID=A0ACB0KTD8_TRIPR|nr:unnamed protein product [Trifolium pratense]